MFLDILYGLRGHKIEDSEIYTGCKWLCNWEVAQWPQDSHFLTGLSLPTIHDKNLSPPLSENEDG